MAPGLRKSLESKAWVRGAFVLSTDSSLISNEDIRRVFDTKEFYWASSFDADAMREMLDNSLTFGLHEITSPTESPSDNAGDLSIEESLQMSRSGKGSKFIGIARCTTDYVTFLYLTDVWVDPSYQGNGLGRWMIHCVRDTVEAMPHLRRALLFTGDWKRSVPFYREHLGMELLKVDDKPGPGHNLALMERKGKGHPDFVGNGSPYVQDDHRGMAEKPSRES